MIRMPLRTWYQMWQYRRYQKKEAKAYIQAVKTPLTPAEIEAMTAWLADPNRPKRKLPPR